MLALLAQALRDLVAEGGGAAQGPDHKQTCGDGRHDNQSNHAHGYASDGRVPYPVREPPRPYGRGFRAFRRDDCFRHGYMTSYEVTPRFRGLLHAHVVLPVGRLAWPGDI